MVFMIVIQGEVYFLFWSFGKGIETHLLSTSWRIKIKYHIYKTVSGDQIVYEQKKEFGARLVNGEWKRMESTNREQTQAQC